VSAPGPAGRVRRMAAVDGARQGVFEGGWTLLELLAGLTILAALVALSLPALATTVARFRLESVTRRLVADMQAARWRALGGGRAAGLKLNSGSAGGFDWTLVSDGDGDGLRTADVSAGIDPAVSRTRYLDAEARGVHLGFFPQAALRRLPPLTGWYPPGSDPLRFGSSDLLSFSPSGGATPGSLYLTDGSRMTAIVVNGVTGRVRMFRLDQPDQRWKELY
ncbi:MAG: Tfp pilus assembly protein FimT/FimU, partial [Acidobacteriota bacterium]